MRDGEENVLTAGNMFYNNGVPNASQLHQPAYIYIHASRFLALHEPFLSQGKSTIVGLYALSFFNYVSPYHHTPYVAVLCSFLVYGSSPWRQACKTVLSSLLVCLVFVNDGEGRQSYPATLMTDGR